MTGRIVAVARDTLHRFAKRPCGSIRLIAGLGVEGDAHFGSAIQHRSRIATMPDTPNLRQVHLLQSELLAELMEQGFAVAPGDMGENLTTEGIDLLGLSRGTRLRLGEEAVIEVTGLRNPCRQIDEHVGRGAMAATLERRADDKLVRKAGVMAIVLTSGTVRPGDAIEIEFTPDEMAPLEPV